MNLRHFGFLLLLFYSLNAADNPNVILVFVDDMGWGDLGTYGNPNNKTPHLDRMAHEGLKLTHFHVGGPMCTPARASILTGTYPKRISMAAGVVRPNSRHGMANSEFTLAEMFKAQGYQTAMFGKWHLGNQTDLLPEAQGFDEYIGIPYSNDMKPAVLLDGDKVIEKDPDQRYFTKRFTDLTIDFIERKKRRSFLRLSHSPNATLPSLRFS